MKQNLTEKRSIFYDASNYNSGCKICNSTHHFLIKIAFLPPELTFFVCYRISKHFKLTQPLALPNQRLQFVFEQRQNVCSQEQRLWISHLLLAVMNTIHSALQRYNLDQLIKNLDEQCNFNTFKIAYLTKHSIK